MMLSDGSSCGLSLPAQSFRANTCFSWVPSLCTFFQRRSFSWTLILPQGLVTLLFLCGADPSVVLGAVDVAESGEPPCTAGRATARGARLPRPPHLTHPLSSRSPCRAACHWDPQLTWGAEGLLGAPPCPLACMQREQPHRWVWECDFGGSESALWGDGVGREEGFPSAGWSSGYNYACCERACYTFSL